MSSSSPDILLRSSESTRSVTRSAFAKVVRLLECGPVGSTDDADGLNWICIDPMRVEASFGQKRGDV